MKYSVTSGRISISLFCVQWFFYRSDNLYAMNSKIIITLLKLSKANGLYHHDITRKSPDWRLGTMLVLVTNKTWFFQILER